MTPKTEEKTIELSQITQFIFKNQDALYEYFVTEWSSTGALQYANIPALLYNCIVMYTYNHQDNGIPANVEQIKALVESWNKTIHQELPRVSNTSPLSKKGLSQVIKILMKAENPVEHVLITTSKPLEDNVAGLLKEPAHMLETFEIDTSQSEKKRAIENNIPKTRTLGTHEPNEMIEQARGPRKKRQYVDQSPHRKIRHQLGAQIRHKKEAVGNIAVSTSYDTSGDAFVANDESERDCWAKTFSPGFDPYIKVTHFTSTSMKAHETACVFNVKRACIWREEDNNVLKWKVRKSDLRKSVLRFCCFDEEIGPDTLTGGHLLYLGDVENFSQIGDTCIGKEIVLKRYGDFCGALTVDLSIRKKKDTESRDDGEYCVLKVTIRYASKLKKQRGADVSADGSIAVFSGIGFILYLILAGWLFEYLEKEEESSKILTWWDGFWFVFITATTVGYGDIVPVTAAGLYINCIIILVDVLFIGFIMSIFFEYIQMMMERKSIELSQSKMGSPLEDSNVKKFLAEKAQNPEITAVAIASRDLDGADSEDLDGLLGNCQEWLDDWGQILSYTFFVIVIVVIGTVVWYFEEEFPFDESFHLCFVTMSTVGYGDIAPENPGGRAFCIFYILFGVGTITKLGTVLFDGIVDQQQEKIYEKIGDESLMHMEQMDEMDIDRTGKVNKFEFMRHLLIQMGKAREADFVGIEGRFRQMDADGTGTISKEDFRLLAEKESRTENEANLNE